MPMAAPYQAHPATTAPGRQSQGDVGGTVVVSPQHSVRIAPLAVEANVGDVTGSYGPLEPRRNSLAAMPALPSLPSSTTPAPSTSNLIEPVTATNSADDNNGREAHFPADQSANPTYHLPLTNSTQHQHHHRHIHDPDLPTPLPPPPPSPKPIRRRMRMIQSCLECRRRKLKCSKASPCYNCERFGRGCVYIDHLSELGQKRLTEVKEQVGSIERQLEREVAVAAVAARSCCGAVGYSIGSGRSSVNDNGLQRLRRRRGGSDDGDSDGDEEDPEGEADGKCADQGAGAGEKGKGISKGHSARYHHSRRRQRKGANIVADEVEREYGGDEGDLQITPMVALDLTYEGYSDGSGTDDLIDLGIRVGRMRITERIGGLNRPRLSEEIQAGIADTQKAFYATFSADADELPDAIPDFLRPGDSYLKPPRSGYLFRQGSELHDFWDMLLDQELADSLMARYYEAVHPIARCVHRPSFDRVYQSFWEDVNNHVVPRASTQAVIFAAWFSASVTIDDAFAGKFGYTANQLINQTKLGTETALSKAGFLGSTSLETLQGFVMYLLPLCRDEVSRGHSVLVGAAIRMAECMGLHRDGSAFDFSAVETEVRRLIWHQICFLDIRTCEAQGPRPAIRRGEYDTKLPLNCEETDLRADTTESPPPAERWTPALLSIIRFEINEMMRSIWQDRRNLELRKTTITAVLTKIEEFRRRLMDKYNRFFDERVPIQQYTKLVMQLLMYRLHAMVLHPYHSNTANPLPDRLHGLLVTSGIFIVEIAIKLESNALFRDWAWYLGAYQQYQIALLLATEVYYRPNSTHAPRIWPCLDWVFNLDPNMPRDEKIVKLLAEIMGKTSIYMGMRRVRAPTTIARAVPGKQAVKDSPPSSNAPPPAASLQHRQKQQPGQDEKEKQQQRQQQVEPKQETQQQQQPLQQAQRPSQDSQSSQQPVPQVHPHSQYQSTQPIAPPPPPPPPPQVHRSLQVANYPSMPASALQQVLPPPMMGIVMEGLPAGPVHAHQQHLPAHTNAPPPQQQHPIHIPPAPSHHPHPHHAPHIDLTSAAAATFFPFPPAHHLGSSPEMVFHGVSNGEALWGMPPPPGTVAASPENSTTSASDGVVQGQQGQGGTQSRHGSLSLQGGQGQPVNAMEIDWDAINMLFPTDPETGQLGFNTFEGMVPSAEWTGQ